MFELEIVSSSGKSLFFPQNQQFTLTEASGLDAPAAAINFSKIPGANGSKYQSGYVEKRNIVLTVTINRPFSENRLMLNSHFVIDSLVRVRYKSGGVHVFEDGYVESCAYSAFESMQKAVISILCPNPFWTEIVPTERQISHVESMFEFPFSTGGEGVVMSEIPGGEDVIIDPGTARSGMIIQMDVLGGIVVSPRIVNNTTGDFFGLRNEFYPGDLIEVNTVTGSKEVTLIRNGEKSSLLSRLAKGSSWVQLVPVKNELICICGQGQNNIRARIYYQRLFQGV